MGKIYYVMGKSASGKDTVFKEILKARPEMKTVVLYTTRPAREGEVDGAEYFFSTSEQIKRFVQEEKVIESRTYETICGKWTYATVDDGQIDLRHRNYLVIGTLESYEKMRQYFGGEAIRPIYVYIEDGLRLERAIARERLQHDPNYRELCRRFLADDEDFSEEKLRHAGIVKRYENVCMECCLAEILKDIGSL